MTNNSKHTPASALTGSTPQFLNLGCGLCSRPGWVNVDFHASSPDVLAYDLRLGIPFVDESFDVVYHSHVLEHFSRSQAVFFLRECFRVLKPGGLLRVAVPDLENIVRAYVAALDAAVACPDDKDAQERHTWMQVELLDQMTRTATGGEMLEWWRQRPIPQKDFIIDRLGEEARLGMESVENASLPQASERCTALEAVSPDFINGGELHRWMYDRLSLASLLKKSGFFPVCPQNFNASHNLDVLAHGLDADANGGIRKPDSLFMEGIKPSDVGKHGPRAVLFSTADSGGAGIAAQRLHSALRNLNLKSELYVLQQKFSHEGVHVLPCHGMHVNSSCSATTASSSASVISELYRQRILGKYPNIPHGCEYFSVPAQFGDFHSVPLLSDFDLVHLHWVAGMLDPSLSFDFLKGRPVVWTLHDMNPFTGGCHYADGCREFERHCGKCPQLGSQEAEDLSRKTWKLRMAAYRQLNLHVVTPSHWLAKMARRSSLFSRFPIHVIPNGHPLDVYAPMNREAIRAALGLVSENLVLLFASQDLTNRRKGGVFLLEMLRKLATSPLKNRVTVLLLGSNTTEAFLESGIQVKPVGHIDDTNSMAALYNAADTVLVPSFEDNLPNVICEAQGCGTPVVAFASGGIPEMILHKKTGFLAATGNADDLLEGVKWADEARATPITRRLCRAHAIEQWHPQQCAQRYMKLYTSLLQAGENDSNPKVRHEL